MVSRGYEASCKSLKLLRFLTLSYAALEPAHLAQCPMVSGTWRSQPALAARCNESKGLQKPLENPHLKIMNNGAAL